jgi:hypothetical protein
MTTQISNKIKLLKSMIKTFLCESIALDARLCFLIGISRVLVNANLLHQNIYPLNISLMIELSCKKMTNFSTFSL